MAGTPEDPDPRSQQLRVQGRKAALLNPWLPILVALNFATLIVAGIRSNTLATEEGSAVNTTWWAWLLILAGSVVFLGWKLRGPFYLVINSHGVEYRHHQLRAAYKWTEVSSFTVAQRSRPLGHRPAVCLRLADRLGPEVLFAQHMSRFSTTPPFRDTATGWIVLCYLNQFTMPAADIDAALTHFAGPHKRVDR